MLKQKTINGLKWSFIDKIASLGLSFIIGIILARLLSPREFGLIGMITVFIAMADPFVNFGFTAALIRKQKCTQADYSTVFYFNLMIGLLFYLLLFFTAEEISIFFNEPLLKTMVRILGLCIIINALSLIQSIRLKKQIDFKLQTKVSIIASVISGAAGIAMAYAGYGVWSLVAKIILGSLLSAIFLWHWNAWKPSFMFSISSFKEMFSFGSNVFVSRLLDIIYRNIYYLIIGKYYAAAELGYYTRAELFQSLPSSTLHSVIGRVSFPVLSTIQDDIPRLKETYKKIIRSTMLITFVLMFGMAAISKPMILTLIGEKWEPCVIYLQMLCFVGMFYPLSALNHNMLYVQGRSDLALRIEIINKVLSVPVIVIAVVYGIKAMILGMILLALISYFFNSYWSGRLIGYTTLEQIKDILPSFLLALIMSSVVFVEGFLVRLPPLPLLIIQLITGVLLTFGLSEAFHLKDYLYIKDVVKDNFFKSDSSSLMN